MGLTSEIASYLGMEVRRAGSLELIASSDAEALLDECARRGVRVLGFEGFRLADGETRPDMSAIADLSDVTEPAESVEEARAIVGALAEPELMLEFTLSPGTD